MPFPLINPKCPDCDVKLKYVFVQIGVHGYTHFKCPECEKEWDNTTLSEILYRRGLATTAKRNENE